MKNETINTLIKRRSVRSYKDEQITKEELDTVLEAGLYAPTGMNKQTVYFAVVQNPELLSKLSKMNAAFMGKDTDPFYGAPTAVIVLSDKNNISNAVADGSLALGNMMNASYSIGLGSCWINRAYEMFESDEGKALLKEWGINGDMRGVGICILGYPSDDLPNPPPRNDNRVFYIS